MCLCDSQEGGCNWVGGDVRLKSALLSWFSFFGLQDHNTREGDFILMKVALTPRFRNNNDSDNNGNMKGISLSEGVSEVWGFYCFEF